MTVLMVAGGTGGHIFPALAVARALQAQGHQVVWLGTRDHMEARLIPAEGLPIEFIRFGGVRGKGWRTLVMLPLSLLRAFVDTWRVLSRVRPAVTAAFGGYVSFPAGMMSALRGIPLLLHEQNAVAGSANRFLVPMADAVLAAFPGAFPSLPARWAPWRRQTVGNPVREAITALADPDQRYAQREGPLRLLVLGGSLGAAALNEQVPKALAMLPEDRRPVVTHQAGARHLEALREHYRKAGVAVQAEDFIADMAAAYAEADVVIARAGATTVFELAAAGLPAILVPYPHAIDDHQTANAQWLAASGAAWLVPQDQLEPARLAELLASMDRESLRRRARLARSLAAPEAARLVAGACTRLGRREL